MNIDLKEIRRMVTTALIQERVGYYGSQVEGDAGESSDAPAIDEMVEEAEQQQRQMGAAHKNAVAASVAKAAEDLVGPLVATGVKSDVVKDILSKLYSSTMATIENAEEDKRKEVEAATADLQTPVTGE